MTILFMLKSLPGNEYKFGTHSGLPHILDNKIIKNIFKVRLTKDSFFL